MLAVEVFCVGASSALVCSVMSVKVEKVFAVIHVVSSVVLFCVMS